MASNNVGGTSISFAGLLTITFVVLKLTHVIAWSWLWVLSPLWISVVLFVYCCLAVAVFAVVMAALGRGE